MQELDSTHISIVVPCYNEEVSLPKFLEEITKTMSGVKHLFPQDNKPFYELIFVNDGSKDKTLEILHNMQKKPYRFDISYQCIFFFAQFW